MVGITAEQKEKNKQYVLDHLEEYVIDSHDVLTNVAPDTEGDEWFFYFGKDKNYEQDKRENLTSNSDNQQSPPNPVPEQPQNPAQQEPVSPNQNKSPSENNPSPTPKQVVPKKQTNDPSPNQDQPADNNPKQNPNNFLPSNTDIQNNYNSDKDKSTIDNNPTLTTPEQKVQAQELLKLIITAELLVKERKFNPETLSQLKKEKEQNTLAYQLLNQEGRIEQAISQLQSIQKKLKNKDKKVGNHQPSTLSLSTKLLIGGGVIVLIVFALLISRSEISPPISGKKKSLLLTGKNEYEKLDRELKEYQELSQEVSKEEQGFLLVEIKNLEEKKEELINKIKEQIIEEEGN
ncbi:5367_t:CDS:2, partial [Ambispora leptoticha]